MFYVTMRDKNENRGKNMYTVENHSPSVKEFFKEPLFEKYKVRRAIEKSTTMMFPFMLFAAFVSWPVMFLTKAFPGLSEGLYYISYMSVQLFGIGLSVLLAYYLDDFYGALTAGVVSTYFAVFCTNAGGRPVVAGSTVIGFMGYFVIGILSAYTVAFLHKVCIVVIEWAFGIIFKLLYTKMKDEKKIEELAVTLRPMLKTFVFLGDSLIVMALAAYGIYLVMNFFYALPMTVLADKLREAFAASQSGIVKGAIIGFSFGFDCGGPVTLSVFSEILDGVLSGDLTAAQDMTVFSAVMIVPSWITLAYFFTYKKFKKHPGTLYDENFLNAGFINEFFQNIRLMSMSPLVYAAREPETVILSYITGSTVTGILARLFNITNVSLIDSYAKNYGLIRSGTLVFTEKYDAYAGLVPPLYAHGGVKVIILSFVAALIGAAVGYAVLIGLKELKYSRQIKRGEDTFIAFGYEYTKKNWEETYSKKSFLEKRLGFTKKDEEVFEHL